MLPPLTLVLGGAASGKSAFAENLLLNSRLNPVYIATSRVWDDETKMRVEVHKDRRSDVWTTFEASFDLSDVLGTRSETDSVLIDCATMWLTNHLLDENDLQTAETALLTAIATCKAPVVIVSNEVGQGIVPDNALARSFREAQGRLNIRLAAEADVVVQIVAGLPNYLKGRLI